MYPQCILRYPLFVLSMSWAFLLGVMDNIKRTKRRHAIRGNSPHPRQGFFLVLSLTIGYQQLTPLICHESEFHDKWKFRQLPLKIKFMNRQLGSWQSFSHINLLILYPRTFFNLGYRRPDMSRRHTNGEHRDNSINIAQGLLVAIKCCLRPLQEQKKQ